MATRVFELARQLKVRSKDILEKCRAEGIELKNHMASLSAGLEETIRDWFSEADGEHTAVETTEHVNLKAARERAQNESRRRKGKSDESETPAEQTEEAVEQTEAEKPQAPAPAEPKPEATEAVEEAPKAKAKPAETKPAVKAEPAPEPKAKPAKAEPVKAEPAKAEKAKPAKEEAPQEKPKAEKPRAEKPKAEKSKAESKKAEPKKAPAPKAKDKSAKPKADKPAELSAEEKAAQKAKRDEERKQRQSRSERRRRTGKKSAAQNISKPAGPVSPAGPQLVPKPAKLKGPRVVRVERPDFTPRPAPRQGGKGGPGQGGGFNRRPGPGGGGNFQAPPMPGATTPDRGGKRKTGPTTGGAGAGKAAAARRSPRRKGTRDNLKETGERLKEWRNQDMAERSARIAAASTSLRRRRPGVKGKKKANRPTPQLLNPNGKVPVEEPITIKSLSAATGIKSVMLIKKLMSQGMMATINQVIPTTTAEEICMEFGVELEIALAKSAEDQMLEQFESREKTELEGRAPVVTFLGHVDHGKTSLLDYIRHTTVASGEAGGITQAIGAYRHDFENQHVVFLDTPGHEAFTAMRARGANMTDVVVLVVAADDGVMPQTIEAISHAKAAGVPIVVALNKVDVPNANINRAMSQLAEHGLQPREWGGDTEVVKTSAQTGEGIEDLIELLSLEAEILELKAENKAPATGYVVEARMDPGKGGVATLLNLNGTLKIGDTLLAGQGFGRVRQIYNTLGKPIKSAPPATPVAVTGLDEVPQAGDKFYITADIEQARTVATERKEHARSKHLAANANAPKTLSELLGKIEAGETHELPILIKADVQGSIEALTGLLAKIGSDEAKLNIIHAGVGGISTGDVTLAEASNAIIIGFNVVADSAARKLAESKQIDIKLYRVIYDIADDLTRALEKGLAPELKEETLGQAIIRQTFKVSRIGTIAGCFVEEGIVQRSAKVRIIRNNVVIEDERQLESLKRVKDDVREVKAGLECGLKIAGYDDIKEGDTLEFYKEIQVARTL